MKVDDIRKFLISGGKKESMPGTYDNQSKSLTMPDKVELLLIPNPPSKKTKYVIT